MKYSTATILTTVLLTSIDIATASSRPLATASTSRPRPQKVDRSRPIRVTPEIAKWSEDFAPRQEALKASSRPSASTTAGPLPPRGPGPLPSSTSGSGLSPRPLGGPSPLPRPSGGPGPLPSSTGGPSLPLPRPTPTPSAPSMTTVRPAPTNQPRSAFQDTLKAALLAGQKKPEVPKPTAPSTSVPVTGAQPVPSSGPTPLPASTTPFVSIRPAKRIGVSEEVLERTKALETEIAEAVPETPSDTHAHVPSAPLNLPPPRSFYSQFGQQPQASSSGAPLAFDIPTAPVFEEGPKPGVPGPSPVQKIPKKVSKTLPGDWLADIQNAKLKKAKKPKDESGLVIGGMKVGLNFLGAGLGAAAGKGKGKDEEDPDLEFSTDAWDAPPSGGAPKSTLSTTVSTANPTQAAVQKSDLTGTVSGPTKPELTGADLQKHRLLGPPSTEDGDGEEEEEGDF